MRITEAARRLGTSPRVLRYRDLLGLLPPVRAGVRRRGAGHRQFDENDLAAVAMGLGLERRYDVSPAAVAFGPPNTLSSDDFPVPLAPTMPTRSLGVTSQSTFSKRTLGPYRLPAPVS